MHKKNLTQNRKIEEKVIELLNDFGYDNSHDSYVNISKLAVSMGFAIYNSKRLPFEIDSMAFPSEKTIFVNDDRTIEEKRCIVARELAHYFSYNKQNDADYFANCILMPEKSFRKKYKKMIANDCDPYDIIDYLQMIFITSREDVVKRIKEVC